MMRSLGPKALITLGALALGNASHADVFTCQFDKFQGHKPLLPNQVKITTQPNSGAVFVQDNLSSSIGQSRLDGEEDGIRPNARRFNWVLKRIPKSWVPSGQQGVAARDTVIFSLSIANGSNKGRLVSQLPIGSGGAAEGALNKATGRCTRS